MVHISRVVNPNVTKELLCLSVLRYPRQSCKFYFFCLKKKAIINDASDDSRRNDLSIPKSKQEI